LAEVRWTEEAAARLQEIHQYLVERSPGAASETILALYRLAESLDRFPERGFVHRTRGGREVRILLYGHYRVVYRVDAGRDVTVIGIFHGAMDLPRYLP
jgi:plasmid stabilization system protein ParE